MLASNGYKGAEAGKAINTMMIRLSAPAKAGEEAIKALGIRTTDAQGNLLNFVDIVGQIEKAFEGMGTAQQANYLDAMFGKQQYSKASAIISAGADALRDYSSRLQNAGGATAQMAGVMRQSLSNKIEVLKSSLTELGFKFIDAFAEKGGEAIQRLTSAVNSFDVAPLIGMAQSVINVIGGIIDAVKFVWQFRGAIMAILVPIALYQGALMGIHLAFEAIKNAKLAYSVALGIAKVVQWAFNAALTANPIGVIIMAVAALIGVIILLAKNWDKITGAIKNNINKVMTVLTILFGPIGFIISMIKEVVSNFGRIKDALAATGLFDKIKEIGASIKGFIQPAIDWLVGVWDTVKNAVMGFFSTIKNALQSFFEPVIQWFSGLWAKVTGFFKGIFDAVAAYVQPALSWIASMWQTIVGFFKDNAIVNAIKVIGGTLLSGILVPIQGLLEILAYIPGLGHLAGKGAEKIEEFRNFLKGVDGATVTADVNMPEKVASELTPPTGTSAPATPDYSAIGYGATGTGGRSKLHGVVDVSGGVIPSIPGAAIMRTATSGADATANRGIPETITRGMIEIASVLRKIDTSVSDIALRPPAVAAAPASPVINKLPAATMPAPVVNTFPATPLPSTVINTLPAAPVNVPAIPETITRSMIEIAAVLRKIDASVSDFSRTLPIIDRAAIPEISIAETVTRTSLELPHVKMNGGDEEAPDYYNPRAIAPITQAERMIYNVEERMQRLVIEVAAEKGTSARIVRAPREASIKLVKTGGNV